MKLRFLQFTIASVLLILTCARPALAQTASDEHAQHHAAPAAPPMTPDGNGAALAGIGSMAGSQPEAAPSGGMGAGMEEMVKQMGTPPRKEIYPSLMALPDEVTTEERAGIEQLAHERMESGTTLLSSGLKKLSASTSDEDYAAMQQATAQMREGLAELEAGIAARRVLAEGKAPRNLALDWFKREMNLASPITEKPRTLLGVPPFHFFTMVLLIAFAAAMVAMYFFKMRRAAALFGRLDPDTKPPSGVASAVPVPGRGATNAAG